MKIAIVSDAIYPYNLGGKEKRIFEISTRLTKKGHGVTIYTMHWWPSKVRLIRENGVNLHAISPLYPLYSGERRSIKEAVMFSLHCFKLIREDFDVMDADHMPHMVLFPLKFVTVLKRKKLIATWHEVWGRKYWVEYMGELGNIAWIIEKLSSYMPSEIISISEHTTKKFKNELNNHKKISTFPIGIDFKEIQKVKPASAKSDIIFAGRLLKHKNVDLLIKSVAEIAKENKKIKCIIVGDGPEKKNLEDLSKELGLEKNIQFLSFLPDHNGLYALFKSSKVFAFPSTREGFGIVALEANACGIPVVVVNHKDNATKDLVKTGKNGFIADFNENSFAEKILQVLKKGNSLKVNSINEASKYNWDAVSRGVEGEYEK